MSFSMETERQKNFLYWMLKLFAKKVNFRQKFNVNLLLVRYIVTLKVFYLLFMNLVRHTL